MFVKNYVNIQQGFIILNDLNIKKFLYSNF